MSEQAIFNAVAISAMLASSAIRWPHARRNRHNRIVHHMKDGLEKALMLAVFAGMMILPLVWIATARPAFANYARPGWLGWIGVAVTAFGLWLFWRSHADLGRNWSPTLEVHDAHTLVTHGVYAYMRHPMYASIFLWCFAQALLLPNWIVGPAGFVTFLTMYVLRTGREERLMLDRFGAVYTRYMHRTGRILPRL